ncbi:uncharacterized protein LOC129585292 [Paramacrobiotus metropolitanus]|uniref:uncharacterized protein LOC129585292 n=1 Tax=Paramacrobiotus metropolitanus TaxID=2943436 RepID=UPI0024462DBB|nr:uncharacterized protein LOC129585292 [Paramacrobiotus metropolitanus]
MSGLRLGVEIGFKKISVALLENGVPRILSSFASIAACSLDLTEWHFGMDAHSYQRDSNYLTIPSVKRALLVFAFGTEDPLVPFLLERLFAYIKMIGETERKQRLQGVVVVLSHGLHARKVFRQAVMDAWQKNDVPDVLLISDVSAILLAYTVQTLDRQSISTSSTESVYLLVCNADSMNCRLGVFEVINNNHVVKFLSKNYVVWNCFCWMWKRVKKTIYQLLRTAGLPRLDQCTSEQLDEECMDQVALFNDPRTDKVTIRAPIPQYVVTFTREMYNAVAEPFINVIRQRVVAELKLFGIMDANTGDIYGKVELLLVGENSRLGLLRTALEEVTKSQVTAGAASYVDDAEAFGAAIASSLAGNTANIHRQHQLFRLQEGYSLNMGKLLQTLPLHANSVLVQPARDIFISERPEVALSGCLYVGDLKKPVSTSGFCLVLSTQKMGGCKVHCIELESSADGHPVTYMRMLLGRNVLLQWCESQQTGSDQADGEHLCIRLQTSFTYRESTGWSSLGFIADDANAFKTFIGEYDQRQREMLKASPYAAKADESFPKLAGSSSSSFVALVSDQLPTKHSHGIHEDQYHPSLITVNYFSPQSLVVVVQQCQEVTGKLQVMESGFVIERLHKICKGSVESATAVLELTVQDCVRVSFPNEASCWEFVKKYTDFWQHAVHGVTG